MNNITHEEKMNRIKNNNSVLLFCSEFGGIKIYVFEKYCNNGIGDNGKKIYNLRRYLKIKNKLDNDYHKIRINLAQTNRILSGSSKQEKFNRALIIYNNLQN